MLRSAVRIARERCSTTVAALPRPRARPAAASTLPSFSSSAHQQLAPSPSPTSPDASSSTNTISQAEIDHFSALAANWWDPTGEFGLLHRMNPARIDFLRDELLRVEELDGARWLQGRQVLDVGCGGGIFAEVRPLLARPRSPCRQADHLPSLQSLARLGADTTAIDAAGQNITMAQTHAALDPSLHVLNSPIPSRSSRSASSSRNTLEYRHCAAEDLVREGKQFDVVCAMEVVEHVEDPRGFLECLMQLTKVRTLFPFPLRAARYSS